MGSGDLKVTQQTLIDTANRLVIRKEDMQRKLNSARNAMNDIENTYHGKISASKRAEFENHALAFNKFCGKIDHYAQFLRTAAALYTEVDEGSTNA